MVYIHSVTHVLVTGIGDGMPLRKHRAVCGIFLYVLVIYIHNCRVYTD